MREGAGGPSYYGWRGADLRNILSFEKDWPNTKVVTLDRNYRSTPNILICANNVIKHNQERLPKALWTSNDEIEDNVAVMSFVNGFDEAKWVARKISELKANKGYENADFVVLYRTNAQSRSFEDALRELEIPYKTVGALSFYARAEIKDILSYLSLLNNSKDDISFQRIVNLPRRGIGVQSIAKLRQYAEFKGWSLYETVLSIEEVPGMGSSVKNKFKAFRDVIEGIRADSEGKGLGEIVKTIYEYSGYRLYLTENKVENAEDRMKNIEELVTAAEQYENTRGEADITDFLELVALSSSTEEYDNEGVVSLMTVHSVKGLEYPVVFMTGMEEELFPSFQSVRKNDLEEERRLCYVGMTRAQERLYMSYAGERMIFGATQNHRVSRFIGELPEDRVVKPNGLNPSLKQSLTRGKHTSADSLKEKIVVGDSVGHKKYGIGKVTQVKGMDLTILFPGTGPKIIDAGYVHKV